MVVLLDIALLIINITIATSMNFEDFVVESVYIYYNQIVCAAIKPLHRCYGESGRYFFRAESFSEL